MYLFTISLLLFYNLFISVTNAEKHMSRRSNQKKFNSNDEECVCFPGGQSLIPELMNPEQHGMERLVVYLYRVENTNQIIVHKPSPEKQIRVPNIPFTEGDIIKVVTTDTFGSLFSNHPYNEHADPIGLNTGNIHSVSPKSNFNEYSPFLSKPKDGSHPNIPSPNWKYPEKSQYQTKRKLIYPQKYQQPNLYLNNGQPQLNYEEFNNPFQPNPVNPNPKIPIVIPNMGNIWEHNEKQYFYPNPTMQLLQPDVVKLLKYNGGQPGQPRWPKPNLTFDNWFNKQMELLQYPQVSQDIRPINNDGLRKLVLKTLIENHIHISATGMMTDENGTPINLEHLDLRPILIGDPVKLQTLQGNQQLTLSQTKPYFEGLLITFDNPPKILGVIPLGKTYVSSQEQIVQAPFSPNIKHYQTPSGFTSTGFDIHKSFTDSVNVPLTGTANNYWNPVTSSGWRRKSQEGSKLQNVETPEFNKDVKILKAEESAKSLKPLKMSTSFEIPGLIKSEASLGLPEAIMAPKVPTRSKKPKPLKPSFESNGISQSRNTYEQLEYNNNYNTPSLNSVVDYYQNAENSLNPYDSGSLQLIESPMNTDIGAYDGSSVPQLIDSEFISESESHLTVAPLNGNSEIYSNSGADSSNPQLTVTELKHNSLLNIASLDGKPNIYPNSNSGNPNLIVKSINYGPPSSSNQFTEPHSSSPKLIAHRMDNNLDFNLNPGSNTQNGHIEHISNPQLIVPPYNTKTDWNSYSNSAWDFHPNDYEPESNNWQQTASSNQLPSIYHEVGGHKSPLPYSHITKNQGTTPPDDEKPSWTSRRKNDETTQDPVIPEPKKPTPQETILNSFEDIQSQNEVVSDSGDLKNDQSRRFSRPLFKNVFKTFIQMVLHNLLRGGGSEDTDTMQYDDGSNVTDVNIEVNSTNHNDRTGVVEDFDRPEFRIIGGSAATGSGAPLSNKGRNGLERG